MNPSPENSLAELAKKIEILREQEQLLLDAYKALLLKACPQVGDKVRVNDLETPKDKAMKVRKLEFLYGEVASKLPQLRVHLSRKDGSPVYFHSYAPEQLEPWNHKVRGSLR
ncbi:MAG: hypothetical protein AB7I41_21700 [Candidatus Sericytochromatia bacterium]